MIDSDCIESSRTSDDVICAARAWADIAGERELTAEEQQRLVEWLQDADHEREFLIALEIRFRLAQVPESQRETLRRRTAAPAAAEPRYLPKRTGSIWRPAVAAAVALLGVGAVLRGLSHRPHYSTGTGERTATFLADGSRVELSSETDLEWLGVGACDRRVRLNRGEALFEVHVDPRCPFQVLLDRVAIEVLGTRFDVYLHSNGAEQVSVLEGRVRIHGFAAGTGQPWQLDVGAGQQAIWGDRPPSIRPFNNAATTAWREDHLEFHGEPLAQVVEELQRYTSIPIRIVDPRLLNVPITALLPVDERHIRASVQWLGEVPPIQVQDDGKSFTLTYRDGAPHLGEHPR